MEETALGIIRGMSGKLPFSVELPQNPAVGNVLDGTKVTDHHAIIPTKASLEADISGMSKAEQSIYYLIAQRLLAATSESMRYQERVVKADCAGKVFSVKGKTILEKGFMAIEEAFAASVSTKKKKNDEKDGEKDVVIPVNLEKGIAVPVEDVDVSEHFTSPPKPFTEDTLLSSMERAGNGEFEKETEKKGLGTPATRAGIIEKLVGTGYVTRKGRQLLATEDAVTLITLLPEIVKSPKMTAEWENQLLLMERGKVTDDDFMHSIISLVEQLVRHYAQVDDAAKSMFGTVSEAEKIGTCPRCGAAVVERKLTFCCASKECNFALWKDNRFMESIGLTLNKKVARGLLSGGYKAKGLVSKKTGKSYNAKITLVENGGKYPGYEMEFIHDRNRGSER
jgi:DNA topoisomerase-3